MWEEIKEELKEKMSKLPAYDDYSDGADQEPQGLGGERDWPRGQKVVKETDAKEQEVDDSSEEKDTNGKSTGDNEHRGRDRRRSRRSWDDDDVKEDVREKYSEFKDYLKRKALKENEEQEAKAEIYRQMERVQMKKFLAEKLEQVMDEYEDQKMKFIFQTTGHFLGCARTLATPGPSLRDWTMAISLFQRMSFVGAMTVT
ncbi:hypothetical protein Btru_060766 [Bulinus truncatus]|nr:hypothetical protein Btru_060766 [Bulinus truncatus]